MVVFVVPTARSSPCLSEHQRATGVRTLPASGRVRKTARQQQDAYLRYAWRSDEPREDPLATVTYPYPPPLRCPRASLAPDAPHSPLMAAVGGTARRDLVLASASPARLRLLRDAGFDPAAVVSGVEEGGVDLPDTAALALELAERKAAAVARPGGTAVVVGCDSLLELGGQRFGKPASNTEALAWLRAMRGRTGTLHTGHCVIDEPTGRQVSAVEGTLVRFAHTTDAELQAYVATGEATAVAGAFTLDGRSAPFVDRVEGNPSNVIGLSLPLLRELLGRLDVSVIDLWVVRRD